MHTAAADLASRFLSIVDALDAASPIPEPERRREQAVNDLIDKLALVTGDDPLTPDQTYTPIVFLLASACRIAEIRPSAQEWLAAIRNVVDAGPCVRDLGSLLGPVAASGLFRDELRLRGKNWRGVADDLGNWLPGSTPAERFLGTSSDLETQARSEVPDLRTLVRDATRLRDGEILYIISTAMRYLVAIGMETRPQDFTGEPRQRFFRPLHDLADRLSPA